jgi:hypothetical protein
LFSYQEIPCAARAAHQGFAVFMTMTLLHSTNAASEPEVRGARAAL